LKHGKGEYIAKNGDIIKTTFVEGLKNGQGTITSKDGKTVNANWNDDI